MENESKKPEAVKVSTIGYLSLWLIGMVLGITFVKSEVARWQRIHDMFLFREAHLYLIISMGIGISMIAILLIKKFDLRSLDGKEYSYKPASFHPGIVIGGTLFGAGWAITGACPGPIYAQMGSGEVMAVFTFIGAMAGVFTYAYLKPKLP